MDGKKEEKEEELACPVAELTRDKEGMLYYKLDDFSKVFK